MRIPVISDTHGLLRPQIEERLHSAPAIIHAGDVGSQDGLDALQAIAPLHVVRGNVDRASWCSLLPETDCFSLGGATIYMIHDELQLDIDPGPGGADVSAVICGHTHKPMESVRDGVLRLNPGSVGPRRFSLPISMAWLTISADKDNPAGVSLSVEFEEFES